MTEQQTPDREKTLAEIEVRELLEGKRIMLSMTFHEASKVLLAELDREREESRKLREELAKEKYANSIIEMDRDNWISDYSELLKELQSAQQEIERLGNLARQERELADHWMRKHHDDVVKLREERDKLIEGLRKLAKTNAENISEIREWKAKQNDPEVTDLDWYNYVARNILKEIGVTLND